MMIKISIIILLILNLSSILNGNNDESVFFYLYEQNYQNQNLPGLNKLYVKKIKDTLNFSVWYVDGQYIRGKLDIEFTNFGHHFDFKFIPENELWIDNENSPGEAGYFITHMLKSYDLISEGIDYDAALIIADSVEKKERMKSALTQEILNLKKNHNNDSIVINCIHQTFLNDVSKNIKVWIVNGELVRSIYFIDFTEGGHDKIYNFVPIGEVWIDNDLFPDERKYVLLHELHERYLMSKGISYDDAHKESSGLEYYCRKRPPELEKKLKIEINRKY